MPYFSDDIIEEVRSRNDIVDCVLFIMRKQDRFLFLRINKCTTASAVEPEGMFSRL